MKVSWTFKSDKALTVAIAAVLAAPMAAQADSHSVSVERNPSIQAAKDAAAAGLPANEGRAYQFRLEGHVNRALVVTDTDNYSTSYFQDNASSGSRIRFTGESTDIMEGVNAKAWLEYGAGSTLSRRHAAVSFGGGFGTLSLGYTSEAADGLAYSDKSGVFGIGHGQETGTSMAAKYVQGMGGTRGEGIHYSSPAFGVTKIHFSARNHDRYSAKLSLSGDAGVAAYGGAVGFLDDGDGNEQIVGSLGIKLGSGLTWSVAGGRQDGGSDPTYMQSTIGYVFGNNAVAVSWYGSDDVTPAPELTANPDANAHPHMLLTTHETGGATALGIGFIHKMPKAGVDIYAAVQQYTADLDDDTEVDDMVAVVGSRISF